MPKVSMSAPLPANAAQVWQLIGQFNALPQWHPAVESSTIDGEGKGSVRTLKLAGGAELQEKLEQVDDGQGGYSYTYSIISSPLPVANYKATIKVKSNADGSGCTVEWEGDYESAGAPDTDTVQIVQGVYQAGLDNLKKMFGG